MITYSSTVWWMNGYLRMIVIIAAIGVVNSAMLFFHLFWKNDSCNKLKTASDC